MDGNKRGDVVALELSLQTLKSLSGDELYMYYRFMVYHKNKRKNFT
jgi:hypothetical protein